jgi:endonuclease YncB( thermonuclease family)
MARHARSGRNKLLDFEAARARRDGKAWMKRHGLSSKPDKASYSRAFLVVLVALPLAAFSAVFFWQGPPQAAALPTSSVDRESAHFPICDGPVRVTCVVDGDTIWYRGEKIRIADINTPEVSSPGCAYEAQLGSRATNRLQVLLNQGAFTLEPEGSGRDEDDYGRKLRVITRAGESLGGQLVAEGLAEPWRGYRSNWC